MGKGEIRTKNQKMAEYMKKKGIQRTTTQCPFGSHPVGLKGLLGHLTTCKAGLGGSGKAAYKR